MNTTEEEHEPAPVNPEEDEPTPVNPHPVPESEETLFVVGIDDADSIPANEVPEPTEVLEVSEAPVAPQQESPDYMQRMASDLEDEKLALVHLYCCLNLDDVRECLGEYVPLTNLPDIKHWRYSASNAIPLARGSTFKPFLNSKIARMTYFLVKDGSYSVVMRTEEPDDGRHCDAFLFYRLREWNSMHYLYYAEVLFRSMYLDITNHYWCAPRNSTAPEILQRHLGITCSTLNNDVPAIPGTFSNGLWMDKLTTLRNIAECYDPDTCKLLNLDLVLPMCLKSIKHSSQNLLYDLQDIYDTCLDGQQIAACSLACSYLLCTTRDPYDSDFDISLTNFRRIIYLVLYRLLHCEVGSIFLDELISYSQITPLQNLSERFLPLS